MLALGAAALGALAAVGGYAWGIEPHWLQVVRRPMPLPGLPPALRGRTLLQLSDLHVGPRVPSRWLVRALRAAAALDADIVACTGDFSSDRTPEGFRELARVLAHLPRGRLATVASLGNHDYGRGWSRLDVAAENARIVEAAGARVLRNELLDLGGLTVVGLADLWSPDWAGGAAVSAAGGAPRGAVEALALVTPERPTIVLCHNPDGADEPGWERVRGWILAGHTHGGQVRLPLIGPPRLPVRNRRYAAGLVPLTGGRTLYVNRGLGYRGHVRLGARPELTLFTLEDAVTGEA